MSPQTFLPGETGGIPDFVWEQWRKRNPIAPFLARMPLPNLGGRDPIGFPDEPSATFPAAPTNPFQGEPPQAMTASRQGPSIPLPEPEPGSPAFAIQAGRLATMPKRLPPITPLGRPQAMTQPRTPRSLYEEFGRPASFPEPTSLGPPQMPPGRQPSELLPPIPPPSLAVDMQGPKPPTRAQIIEMKLAELDRPPGWKKSLAQGLATFGFTGLAGLVGGEAAASGAAQGAAEALQQAGEQRQLERRSLQGDLEKELDRQGKMAERELIVDAQIQAIQQRAEAAEARAQSAKEVADIRAQTQKDIADLRSQVQTTGQAITLRGKGLRYDAQGNIVPIGEEDMTPTEKAALDLKRSMNDLTTARADLERAKNDPDSPLFKQAQQRLNNAQQMASIAMQRLGLSESMFEANLFGTVGGVGVPGAVTDEFGRPLGLNVAPPTAGAVNEQVQANAESGLKAMAEMQRQMDADPNIRAKAAIPGSPGARIFVTARNEVMDVLTRLRTGAAINDQELAFYQGQVPGALDGDETVAYKMQLFRDLFTRLSTGGKTLVKRPPGPGGGAGAGAGGASGTIRFQEGAAIYNIPAGEVPAFQKAHPRAKRILP